MKCKSCKSIRLTIVVLIATLLCACLGEIKRDDTAADATIQSRGDAKLDETAARAAIQRYYESHWTSDGLVKNTLQKFGPVPALGGRSIVVVPITLERRDDTGSMVWNGQATFTYTQDNKWYWTGVMFGDAFESLEDLEVK